VAAVVVTILRALVITAALVVAQDNQVMLEVQVFQGRVLLALQVALRLVVVEVVLALLV
jgi:hypothetical protein